MFPVPCEEAIELFSSRTPEQWVATLDREKRTELLQSKAKSLIGHPLRKLRRVLPPDREELDRPYPALPQFLRRRLNSDVIETIVLYFPDGRERIRAILDDRVSGHRYGTDWIDGRWRIVAPPLRGTLQDLMALSHELGHILADENKESTAKDLIRGEATAMVLEATIVAKQLGDDELKSWLSYLSKSDTYNFEFFHREYSCQLESLMNRTFILRESLWTSHGYQAVYAAASYIRAKILREIYPSWFRSPERVR